MPPSYAVTWRNPDGSQFSGRLSFAGESLQLEGVGSAQTVSCAEIARVHMARSAGERIDGRQTLVLERRSGGSISIAGVGQPGVLVELADRLAALAA